MFDTRYCVAYLKPTSTHFSTVCGCLLERERRGVFYFPCEDHRGIPYEIDVSRDGDADLFMDRPDVLDWPRWKEG